MTQPVFDRHDLRAEGAIAQWDQGLPLGNGNLGVLVWGDGSPLRLSLDRADLWDLRPVPEWAEPNSTYAQMRQWVEEGRIDQLHRLFDEPYLIHPGPTKIPAGRLELDHGRIVRSQVHLASALAEVELEQGGHLTTFVHATEPVGWLHGTHLLAIPSFQVVAPAYAGDDQLHDFDFASQSVGSLASLGYPAPIPRQEPALQGFVQSGWGNTRYAVVAGWQSIAEDEWLLVWTISASTDGADVWEHAATVVQHALKQGWQAAMTAHQQWWHAYWERSTLSIPNPTVEAMWYRSTYLFGSAARPDAPPISLQAVWTADEGKIPPWKGDYHHDLNTQMSYWPCYAGNHLDEGRGFLDWLWSVREECETFTRRFFDKPGLAVPGATDLLGRPMGGWHQYAFSATVSAWLSHHFYLHWRYSQDRQFLRERAYPYLQEVCTFLEAITEIGPDGKRFLPLSSSPEIHDDRLDAWLPPTTNYDLALLHWVFGAAAELADEVDESERAHHWREVLATLPSLTTSAGRLLVAPGTPLGASHRHCSHLLAIYPLKLIVWNDGLDAQKTLQLALEELERLGTDEWCGYTYAWLSSLAARAGAGKKAEQALEIFATAFCSPNSFHLNGDQSGKDRKST